MRLVRFACFLIVLLFSVKAMAQLPVTPEGVKQPRILILMDGSSSMLYPWGNKLQRFGAAAKIVSTLMDSIYKVNNQVEFALRVYGHQYPAQENNCTDTRLEVMFSKDNYTQMALRMASLHPSGVSPIAYSLKEAANNDLDDEEHNAYSIILITDGGESCNGDICDVVRTLIERKVFFKPYILSLLDDAPLRTQYACLGNYLTVAREDQLGPAVSTIVADYRPLLRLPILVATKPIVKTPAPAVKTITIPAWIPEYSTINTLPIVIKLPGNQGYHYNLILRPLNRQGYPLPKVVAEQVVTIVPPPKKDPVIPVVTPAPKPIPEVKPPVVKPVVAAPTPAKDTAKTSVVIKALPPAIKPPKKNIPSKPQINEVSYTSSSEDAKETTVQIFFTDGHGHFYKTTPRLQLIDAGTNKLVKEFFRTVDGSGGPDALPIPAGRYNLEVPGRNKSLLRNVNILPNKNNKILAIVSNGSLIFRYAGDPERPVEEFTAIVNVLFEPGPTIQQKCSQELEYTPGNYHVEVNTLPVKKYNTDIDFGNATILSVPQPGYVQFNNKNAVGKIVLYQQLGDRFSPFYDMMISGSPQQQKLRLQPGPYEIHWAKNPNMPGLSEKVLRIQIVSNSVTEIELH